MKNKNSTSYFIFDNLKILFGTLNFTGIVLALAFLVVFLITGTKIALGLGLLFSTLIIMDSLIISIFKK